MHTTVGGTLHWEAVVAVTRSCQSHSVVSIAAVNDPLMSIAAGPEKPKWVNRNELRRFTTGFLDQRDALHHEERHLVSNFLGTNDMRIDMGSGVELRPRDTVLVASDGLTDNVHLDEIIERIRKGPLLDGARALTSLAHHRMANGEGRQPSKPDDLSVLLFRKPESGRSIIE